MSKLLDAFNANAGIVCAVGAGGKKSTLYRLAREHPGRVGVTATSYTTFFPRELNALEIVAEAPELQRRVLASAGDGCVAYARPGDKPARLRGVPTSLVGVLHHEGGFDVTFVKADGARMRWLKSPRDDEPVIPEGATTVLMLVSARVLGEPLDERVALRLDYIHRLCGTSPGDIFSPHHLATLFSDERGLLKGSEGCVVIPVINMVDDEIRAALAEEAARLALERSERFDRVVLACMKRDSDPLVAVIRR
ncbi:MAG: selenium cofactor biosynthesis protein YqeC [Gammaproteobacteria bacterium]|nr:selenium cofactor biosynthesis protein YqeC [Gammaproteobacteria bacterium]